MHNAEKPEIECAEDKCVASHRFCIVICPLGRGAIESAAVALPKIHLSRPKDTNYRSQIDQQSALCDQTAVRHLTIG
jgi:ferredoxin